MVSLACWGIRASICHWLCTAEENGARCFIYYCCCLLATASCRAVTASLAFALQLSVAEDNEVAMAPGVSAETESWAEEYDEAKATTQEVVQMIQDRNVKFPHGGPEASRITAAARRKLGTLGTQIERLFKWLDSEQSTIISEQEKYRRRDLLHALKSRREQVLLSLKRSQQTSDRETLLAGGSTSGSGRETEQTAELDNRGLLQLQNNVIQLQDEELAQMEKTVTSTKHIALAIGEEVDLHTRLLEDLDEDVDATHFRLKAASKRLQYVMKHASNWKGGFIIFLIIIVLTVVMVVGFKLLKLFT